MAKTISVTGSPGLIGLEGCVYFAAQIDPCVDQNRASEHICCRADRRKMRTRHPKRNIRQSLGQTIRQMVEAWRKRPAGCR